jgi:hypothetical protein
MTNSNKYPILSKLISRGDRVEFINGKLVIQPKSGNKVPEDWLKKNEEKLTSEIAEVLNVDICRYEQYSTGEYGKQMYQGVTLNFRTLNSLKTCYVNYNAVLTYQRNTKKHKKGDRLPKKQFYLSKRYRLFNWFSKVVGNSIKPSEVYRYMGRLKQFYFMPEFDQKGKITEKQIKYCVITYEQILQACQQININKVNTSNTQGLHNPYTTTVRNNDTLGINTSFIHNDLSKSLENKRVEENLSTCKVNCEQPKAREGQTTGEKKYDISIQEEKIQAENNNLTGQNIGGVKVVIQSDEDWLAEAGL